MVSIDIIYHKKYPVSGFYGFRGGSCRGELHSLSYDTGAFLYFGINIVSLRQLKSIS